MCVKNALKIHQHNSHRQGKKMPSDAPNTPISRKAHKGVCSPLVNLENALDETQRSTESDH